MAFVVVAAEPHVVAVDRCPRGRGTRSRPGGRPRGRPPCCRRCSRVGGRAGRVLDAARPSRPDRSAAGGARRRRGRGGGSSGRRAAGRRRSARRPAAIMYGVIERPVSIASLRPPGRRAMRGSLSNSCARTAAAGDARSFAVPAHAGATASCSTGPRAASTVGGDARRRCDTRSAMWSSQAAQRFHLGLVVALHPHLDRGQHPHRLFLADLHRRGRSRGGARCGPRRPCTRSLRPRSRPAVCGPRRHLPPL